MEKIEKSVSETLGLVSGFIPQEETLARVRKMLLLGFSAEEMIPALENSLSRNVAPLEVQNYVDYLREAWAEKPEAQALMSSEGESFSRTKMFLSDLLTVYQDMLLNHRADLDGLFNHPDGRPVKPVKPLELAAMAEKITSLERKMIEAQRESALIMGTAEEPDYQPPALALRDDAEMDEEIVIPQDTAGIL